MVPCSLKPLGGPQRLAVRLQDEYNNEDTVTTTVRLPLRTLTPCAVAENSSSDMYIFTE